ncbi:uncharacterized protein LOC133501824 isoform X2 [Syngnathoides biaculeatus]|uniref:uncharacterized protein LOC133501824 isoform X2 n=1 Tax=Syngnathoides biaculeatus TaxID=300417 RepID=UPI002ADD9FF0|nr:uncharacterized protein LOC133501824 isoform X2 [Syngnathoides biaculeatus]
MPRSCCTYKEYNICRQFATKYANYATSPCKNGRLLHTGWGLSYRLSRIISPTNCNSRVKYQSKYSKQRCGGTGAHAGAHKWKNEDEWEIEVANGLQRVTHSSSRTTQRMVNQFQQKFLQGWYIRRWSGGEGEKSDDPGSVPQGTGRIGHRPGTQQHTPKPPPGDWGEKPQSGDKGHHPGTQRRRHFRDAIWASSRLS